MYKLMLVVMATIYSTSTFSQKISDKNSLLFRDSATQKLDLQYYILVYDVNGVPTYSNELNLKAFYLRKYGMIGLYTKEYEYAGFYSLEADKIKFIKNDLK